MQLSLQFTHYPKINVSLTNTLAALRPFCPPVSYKCSWWTKSLFIKELAVARLKLCGCSRSGEQSPAVCQQQRFFCEAGIKPKKGQGGPPAEVSSYSGDVLIRSIGPVTFTVCPLFFCPFFHSLNYFHTFVSRLIISQTRTCTMSAPLPPMSGWCRTFTSPVSQSETDRSLGETETESTQHQRPWQVHVAMSKNRGEFLYLIK